MKIKDIVSEATAAETTSSAMATSMGGNGFVNGGPGTLKRTGSIKKSKKKKHKRKQA